MLDNHSYKGDHCLSGTAEMALAGYLMNRVFCVTELPLKLAAVSRCYRAETSRMSEERGIYRQVPLHHTLVCPVYNFLQISE
jgi:seryl-tRNA synthetase